jgi:phage regulator Rha-like protein
MRNRLPEKLAHPLKGDRKALLAGIEEIDGEPCMSSLALANYLGISHRALRRLIKKHKGELEKLGPLMQRRR